MTTQEKQEYERLFVTYHKEFQRIYTAMLQGGGDMGYAPEDLFRCILFVAAENIGPQYPERRDLIARVREYA